MARPKDYTALALFIALNAAVSALGGWVTASSVGTWYLALDKPPFNPPDWIFAPVRSALYLMIAVAGWRAWRRATGPRRQIALTAYAVQLALNLSWSFATLLNAALWRLN